MVAKEELTGTQIGGRDVRLDFASEEKPDYGNTRDDKKEDFGDPTPGKVLGVFGLNTSTTEKQLEALLGKHGVLEKVIIVTDNMTHRSRGFAFAYFSSILDAKNAKEALNGAEVDGREIRVDFSFTKTPHAATPGQYMGTHKSPRGGDSRYTPYSSSSRSYGGGGFSGSRSYGGGGGERSYGGERGYNARTERYRSPVRGRRSFRERSYSPMRGGSDMGKEELYDAFKKIYPLLMKLRR